MSWCLNFVLFASYVCFHILVKVTEWPPIGKIAAHLAYDMFSWYKYLIANFPFPTSVFGVGISFRLRLFLIVGYLYLSIESIKSIMQILDNQYYDNVMKWRNQKEIPEMGKKLNLQLGTYTNNIS